MKWGAPHNFWFIIVAVFWLALLLWELKQRKIKVDKVFHEQAQKRLMPNLSWSRQRVKQGLFFGAVVFFVLALARPQWGKIEESVKLTGLDILFVVDLSTSMDTEDVVPSRIKKTKHWIRSFLDRVTSDRVGLLGFAESSSVFAPLTTDIDYVKEQLEIIDTKSFTNQGTAIGAALNSATLALQRGSEGVQGKEAQELPSKIIILISDGEDHEAEAEDAAKKLKEIGVRLITLGVGTEKGGPIPVKDDLGQVRGYKRDKKGQAVTSQFSPKALMRISDAASGRYWNITTDEAELAEVFQEIGKTQTQAQGERKITRLTERFQLPLVVGLLFLLAEFFVSRTLRTQVGAILLMLITSNQTLAFDESIQSYLENRSGLEAYKTDRLSEAKEHFDNAQSESPSSPELFFNQGVLQYRQEDFDGSINSFNQALIKSPEQLKGDILFNLGLALEKKGSPNEAVTAYINAIEEAKKRGNEKLEQDARKNLELLVAKIQEQKKQEQQKKDGNKEQKDSQDGSDPQQNSGDKDSEGNKEKKEESGSNKDQKNKRQASRYKETPEEKRRQFKSEKLDEQAARRVMDELSKHEKDLKTRYNRNSNGKANQQPSAKDW